MSMLWTETSQITCEYSSFRVPSKYRCLICIAMQLRDIMINRTLICQKVSFTLTPLRASCRNTKCVATTDSLQKCKILLCVHKMHKTNACRNTPKYATDLTYDSHESTSFSCVFWRLMTSSHVLSSATPRER